MNAVVFPLLAVAIVLIGLFVIWLVTRSPKARPYDAMENFNRQLDALAPPDESVTPQTGGSDRGA